MGMGAKLRKMAAEFSEGAATPHNAWQWAVLALGAHLLLGVAVGGVFMPVLYASGVEEGLFRAPLAGAGIGACALVCGITFPWKGMFDQVVLLLVLNVMIQTIAFA